MTADSSTTTVTISVEDGSGNSPSGRRTLTSPWAQVVRGVIESDSIPSSPLRELADPVTAGETPAPEDEPPVPTESQPEGCNAGGVKKPAWNNPPANGVVEATATPIMDADLWPALSESTRPGGKSVFNSSESSSKLTSDISAAGSQASVISQPPPKQVKPNANNVHPRQKPMRRGGSAGYVSTGHNQLPPPPPLPPPFPLFDMYGNLVPPPPVLESPQAPFKGNNWSPRSVDPSLNRNPSRRNNFGPRPLNSGGRRDHHDRNWRGPRSHQMGPPPPLPHRGFIRAPAPFIPPQPLRPFHGAPMGYDMGASFVYVPTLLHEPYRCGASLLPHGAPGSMYMPHMDHPLHGEILRQIEYYFCDANLVKDNYLKSHMDEEGWVPITLIAGFRRVQMLSNDIQIITSALNDSSIIEIQGYKVRRRNDWRKWINTSSQSASESTNNNSIEKASLQKLLLEDGPTNEKEVSDSPKLAYGEVSCEESYS